MRKNYTLSNLPMAAVVLLVASLPCFAQVTANESSSVLAIADNRPTIELNKNSRAVPSSSGETSVAPKNVERVKSPLSLSPNAFKVSDKFSIDSKFFSVSQMANGLDTSDSKRQFRVDDDTPVERSRVTFVPSRGQRLPNAPW